MTEAQELRERFELIRNFYSDLVHRITQSDEWAFDAYAWTSERSGIVLTPIEEALWEEIRIENIVMYPQFPVGRFFVDFGNPVAKVAIECDGAKWHMDKDKDAQRDAELQALGWTVYRITGRACLSEDREYENEDGGMVYEIGEARRFVRGIASRHPIRRFKASAPLRHQCEAA